MTTELAPDQQLFPLDPWGCEGVFVVVDHPHSAIARAIVGPLVQGLDQYSAQKNHQCIVLHSGRHFLFNAQIPSILLAKPESFWEEAASQCESAKRSFFHDDSASLAACAEDSIKDWFDAEFWMPVVADGQQIHRAVHVLSKLLARHEIFDDLCGAAIDPSRYEQMAQIKVADQLKAAQQLLFRALAPELRVVYTHRPGLSTGMVNRLLALAQAAGVQATKYMLQALQTESFGLLHLMAFGDDCIHARELLKVVLNGGSLPTKLSELGIPKGVHRRTLIRVEHLTQQQPSQQSKISNMPISGPQWLGALRVISQKPVHSTGDWDEFGDLVEQLQLLSLSDKSLNSALIKYCVRDGYRACSAVLKRLCTNARALKAGAMKIALIDLAFNDALSIALKWEIHLLETPMGHHGFGGEYDWSDPAELVTVVCQQFGGDADGVFQSMFTAHPGLPKGLPEFKGLALLPLDSMALTFFYGEQLGNCLATIGSAACYIAKGRALYGVHEKGVPVCTIALKWNLCKHHPDVHVVEISGRDNKNFGHRLEDLGLSLVAKWNANFDIAAWTNFFSQCQRLSSDL